MNLGSAQHVQVAASRDQFASGAAQTGPKLGATAAGDRYSEQGPEGAFFFRVLTQHGSNFVASQIVTVRNRICIDNFVTPTPT
jgi:hypothetical protein